MAGVCGPGGATRLGGRVVGYEECGVLEDFFVGLLALVGLLIAGFALLAVRKLYQGQR